MQIVVDKAVGKLTEAPSHPYVLLRSNTWDDYGYKTTFEVVLVRSHADRTSLGSVKILRSGQTSGITPLPQTIFETLGPDYCSLGTDVGYYDEVARQGEAFHGPFLLAMRDAAVHEDVKLRFEEQEGFKVSLLRFSNAERALAEAAKHFATSPPPETQPGRAMAFRFETSLAEGASPATVDFDFESRGDLPHRINVLIGYNGSGKTRMLSNLAVVTHGYGYANKEDLLHKRAGRFVGAAPAFPTVVVVSFSAFDDFVLPGSAAPEKEEIVKDGSIFGYSYVGLREPRSSTGADGTDPASYRLRSPAETEAAFVSAFGKVHSLGRSDELERILAPLAADASFKDVSIEYMTEQGHEGRAAELFRTLSSGHKIVLIMLVELTVRMDGATPTLVLIDEPENHLHPPLLATLLKSIRVCLAIFDGYAVIATHSPVVLQETPSRCVRVLRRGSGGATLKSPAIETFGEGIGVITHDIFNLDDETTDWHDTLKLVAKGKTPLQLEELFGRRLGFEALSYLASSEDDEGS